MTDRDLTKTLPGTGPTPLVDGDAVATILRDLVLGVDALGKGLHAKLDTLTPPPPVGPSALPASTPPPSRRQAAASATVNLAKWGTLAIGILGIAAQVAKVWRPSLVAPLDQALDLLHQLTGSQ